jgi:SPP1 family predicted phage head-tail adaptor
MSSVGAGARKWRISFQRATITKNAMNEPVKTWGGDFTERAAVRFGAAQERRVAGQEGGALTATFIVLHNSRTKEVQITDRIVFDGADWDITSNVPSVEFNAHRDITATRAT